VITATPVESSTTTPVWSSGTPSGSKVKAGSDGVTSTPSTANLGETVIVSGEKVPSSERTVK